MPNGKDLGKLMGDKYYEVEVEPPARRLTQDGLGNTGQDEEFGETELLGNETTGSYPTPPPDLNTYHPWGIFFTIIGTVLLDFDADACQSPSRAYLLDVTLPGKG